jgi:hypothetical protein
MPVSPDSYRTRFVYLDMRFGTGVAFVMVKLNYDLNVPVTPHGLEGNNTHPLLHCGAEHATGTTSRTRPSRGQMPTNFQHDRMDTIPN